MPIVLKTQAFHTSIVFKRRTIMNAKAQHSSVVRTDSAYSEESFVPAIVTATALSSTSPEASTAFSKLLWALGSSSEDVGQMAERWIETIEETGSTGPVDPKKLVEVLMIGAEACLCPASRQSVRRH
jgi:hypothetical protein